GAYAGFLQNAARTNENAVADFGIANHGIRANAAGGADTRFAQDLDERLDHRVGGDFDVVVDHAGSGKENSDALGHQFVALAQAHLIVDVGEFGPRVGAENFAGVVGFPD